MAASRLRTYRDRLGPPGLVVAAAALLLSLLGLVVVASVDLTSEGAESFASKQANRLLLAIPLVSLVFLARPRWIRANAYPLYALSATLLAAVFVWGPTINGARRWLRVAGQQFQPSDLAKLALCLALARLLERRSRATRVSGLALAVALTAVPFILVLKEPDLGTALNFVPILAATLWVAGAQRKHLLAIAGLALVGGAWLVAFGLHGYQQDRVKSWWHQNELTRAEKLAEGYHLHRSKIAIGSGGLFGYGFGEGPQNRNDLLPERHTDFAFAVLSEEWGFAGATLVLVLELAIPLGLLALGSRVRDRFARVAIVAIAAQVGSQALVNLGVATGAFPTTGIALPLVSYGGTSAIMTLVSLAVALQLAARAEPVLAAEEFEASELESALQPRR